MEDWLKYIFCFQIFNCTGKFSRIFFTAKLVKVNTQAKTEFGPTSFRRDPFFNILRKNSSSLHSVLFMI